MAAGQGLYGMLFKVLGAGAAVSANRQVAAGMRHLDAVTRQTRAGMLGMRSALTGQVAVMAAAGLAVRRVVRDYEQYSIAQSRIRTTLAAQVPNYRRVSMEASGLADVVGARLGYSLTEANNNMNTMLETGLDTERAMRVFETSMQLARVGEMETSAATQFLTDTMNMFREEQAETGEETRHFARRMSSQLAGAAVMASTDINQLQVAFRYAGGAMAAMGYSSQETMAGLAGLSSMGMRGSVAGTRLRQVIARLSNITPRTIEVMRELGIEEEELQQILFDSSGAQRPLEEGMQRLTSIFQRLPSAQARSIAMFQMFGMRGVDAGVALAGMSEATDRIYSIMNDFRGTDVTDGTLLDRMNAERMNSFGMQMEQLRQGASDLAIAFGEMLFGGLESAGRGFGTVFREVATATRLFGNMNRLTATQRREWAALSPETQEYGRQISTLFRNLIDIARVLGSVARLALLLANTFPRTTLAVVGLSVAFGGFSRAVVGVPTVLSAIGSRMLWMRGSAVAATGATSMLRGSVALLTVYLAGKATSALQEYLIDHLHIRSEVDQLRESTVAQHRAVAAQIPIIGDLVAQWLDVAGAIQQVIRLHDEQEDRRARDIETNVNSSANDRITARMTRLRQSSLSRYQNMSEDELRAEATNSERSASRRNAAQMMYGAGIRTSGRIADMLEQFGGMEKGEQMTNMINEILTAQRGMNAADVEDARNRAPTTMGGLLTDWDSGIRGSARQLIGFDAEIERSTAALNEFVEATGGPAPSAGPQSVMPPVQDAYVRRGGFLNVSSGDVVVARNNLANALSMSRGGAVGPAGNTQQTVGPPPTATSSSASSSGDIVIQIDGREIARVVGRQHASHLERSGAPIAPGQRRTLSETGFSERLG